MFPPPDTVAADQLSTIRSLSPFQPTSPPTLAARPSTLPVDQERRTVPLLIPASAPTPSRPFTSTSGRPRSRTSAPQRMPSNSPALVMFSPLRLMYRLAMVRPLPSNTPP